MLYPQPQNRKVKFGRAVVQHVETWVWGSATTVRDGNNCLAILREIECLYYLIETATALPGVYLRGRWAEFGNVCEIIAEQYVGRWWRVGNWKRRGAAILPKLI